MGTLKNGLVRRGKYWHYRFKIRGIEYAGSTRCTDLRSARMVLEQIRRETVLGEHGIRKAPTLGATIEAWFKANSRAKSAKHLEAAQLATEHLRPLLQVPLERITNDRVELWRNEFLAGHAPATADFALRYLRLFCNWARKARHIRELAFDTGPLNKRRAVRPVVKAGDMDTFLAAVDRRNPQISVAVRVHLRLGLREKAVLNMRWEDLDLEARTVRVIEKGDRERVVGLPPSVMEVLQLLMPRQASPWIFPDAKGEPHRKGWLRRALQRGGAAIGAERFGVHRLRASFATMHKHGGTAAAVIQDMMGHADLSTTQRYFEEDLAAQRQAMEALEQRSSTA